MNFLNQNVEKEDLVQQVHNMDLNEAIGFLDDNLLHTIYELQDSYLNFKLGKEQIDILLGIFKFIQTPGFDELVLSGPGGSGKSAITKLIVQYLEDNLIPYTLATPTNKACGVLQKYTEREVTTLHKLLTLKPTLDILKLDLKDLQWASDNNISSIPYNGVLIIDECSMINSNLYDFIKEKAQSKNCKIIYTGDSKQLYPVKEKGLSKPFRCANRYYLTKVYRQKGDNPILDVLEELRHNPINSFKEIRSENGSLIIYHKWRDFLNNSIDLFKESVKTENTEIIKLLAYTNKRVEAFNQVIRGQIFNSPDEYCVGEILMGYDSCVYKTSSIDFDVINSEEYVVRDIMPGKLNLGGMEFDGYYLYLHPINSEYFDGEIFVISRNTPKEKFNKLAYYIESLRLVARSIKNKQKAAKAWREYFEVMECFATPIDLIYDGRTVRKKTLDYGYCLSVHKSQGSNYDNVLVDMGNLFICKNREELRQLQYVAMSRTRKNVNILL